MQKQWILIGAILAGLAVVTGAVGAHLLVDVLKELYGSDPDLLARRSGNWDTAALYQMHHAIGLILVGIVGLFRKSKWLTVAGWCFFVGTLLFSGSLYVLALTDIRVLGAVTPFGGFSFIAGWIALAAGGCCLTKDELVQLK